MTLEEVFNQSAPWYKLEILKGTFTIKRMGRDYYISELMAKVKRENFMKAIEELQSLGDIQRITIGDWIYLLQEENNYKKIFKKDIDKQK